MIKPKKYLDPKLVDNVVQTIQLSLEDFNWIGVVYPLSRIGVTADGLFYPQIYRNDGSVDNISIQPDDSVKSYAYFSLEGDVRTVEDAFDEYTVLSVPLGLTFWGQLDKMFRSKKYDYTSELINDILVMLKDVAKTPSNNIESIEEVHYSMAWNSLFGKYTYSEQDKQLLLRNYTGFVIYFTVITDSLCMKLINT